MTKKLLFIGTFIFITCSTLLAQVKNVGILQVQDGTELYISSSFDFGTNGAQTKTTRETLNGVVSITAAGLNATAESNLNFVDGFVRLYPSLTAEFYKIPLGYVNTYGPIGVLVSNSQPITTAYFLGNPSVVTSNLDTDLENISTTEYWRMNSTNTGKIRLYWNENTSAIQDILGSKPFEYLTIAGYDGTKWTNIDSQVNSELKTITTFGNLSLGLYSSFAIGAKKDLKCYSPVVSSGITKTWTGTNWEPSSPTIVDPVVIDGPLTIINPIECYSVVLNNTITMTSGKKLTVAEGFSGNGKIIMSSLASVIQQNHRGVAPKIEMTKIATQMRRFDYDFLSNPITDPTAFFAQLLNKNNVATNGNFGVQGNSAFNSFKTFNLPSGSQGIDANATNMTRGKGFTAMVRSQAPYSNSLVVGSWNSQKEDVHIKIAGQTNNGRFTIDLPNIYGYSYIGNPYPSPMNAKRFLELTEGKIYKTLYYWTYNTARASLSGNSYNNADYATYNATGGVAATSGGAIPDGTIMPMQSVIVQSMSSATTLTIDNCVRYFDEAQGKATNDTDSNGKFRLNLQGSGNSFSQILVAYDSANGTIGFDNGYDSYRFSGTTSELSTLLNNSRLAIQTKAAFNNTDVVPLILDKRTDETFTISLATTEGIFENTPVFLHDKVLEIYHSLAESSYSFTQNNNADGKRFEIVYQNQMLGNGEFNTKIAFAYINNYEFRAQANSTIEEIEVYDLSGRLIITYSDLNSLTFSSPFDKANGVYIAKIKLANGTIVNQKVIHVHN
jgi:hypothetical protein